MQQLLTLSTVPSPFYIRAEKHSALFFGYIRALLKKGAPASPIAVLDLDILSLDELYTQCSITFLAQQYWYIIRALEPLAATKKAALAQYLEQYTGPHKLIIYTTEQLVTQPTQENTWLVAANIDQQAYSALYTVVYGAMPDQSFVSQLFSYYKQIDLDKACLFMHYQLLLGRSGKPFFKEWLTRLDTPQASLFTLSGHLFSRQQQHFFTYWLTIKDTYPDEFWIIFWSDQIWHAALFVLLARTKTLNEAKQRASKVPFCFIQKEWKQYSYSYLVAAHNALARIDYSTKTGTNTCGLELWYHQFFLKRFTGQ